MLTTITSQMMMMEMMDLRFPLRLIRLLLWVVWAVSMTMAGQANNQSVNSSDRFTALLSTGFRLDWTGLD